MHIPSQSLCFNQQPFFRYCGQCQIKTILQYYGIDGESLKNCSPSWLSSKTGFIFPKSFSKLSSRFPVTIKIGRKNDNCQSTKIKTIKQNIDNGIPTILLIAHGYTIKQGELVRNKMRRMITMHHWISVRGYCDDKKIFYIYDTSQPQKAGTITNIELSYDEIIYYRDKAFFGLQSNLYVEITKNAPSGTE